MSRPALVRALRIVLVVVAALVVVRLALRGSEEWATSEAPSASGSSAAAAAAPQPAAAPDGAEPARPALPRSRLAAASGAVEDEGPDAAEAERRRNAREARDAAFWRSADIEDYKEAIYALEIDSVARIPLLEDLVHVEVEDVRTLWDTDWSGVDDWKRRKDGFTLERAADGTLMFVPGQETQRAYTFFESINLYEYDESNEAFVNEVDYYGKPIYNVVKFLREDVLVLMTISGHKVDLNIFEKGEY